MYSLVPEDTLDYLKPFNQLSTEHPIIAFSTFDNIQVAFVNHLGEVTVWNHKERLAVCWEIDSTLVGTKATAMVRWLVYIYLASDHACLF